MRLPISSQKRTSRLRRGRRGQALIAAILALTVLTAGAIALSAQARLELRAARRGVDQLRREAALKGAINRGIALLEQGRTDPERLLTELRSHTELRWEPMTQGTEAGGTPMLVALQLVDASSRLSLQGVTSDQLQKLPDLDRETAQAILKWRDTDEGADDGDYAGRPRPYEPKDRPFDTLEELLLVEGVDLPQFFGSSTLRETRELKAPPLSEFLTVISGENNIDGFGNARANVNTAGEAELLEAANREGQFVTPEQVRRIVARQEQHRAQIAGGMSPGQSENPFRTALDAIRESGAGFEYYGVLLDAWTADTRAFLPNRINVNTAPEAVLEVVPGLTGEMRNELLRLRRERPEGLSWTEVLQALGVQQQGQQNRPTDGGEGGEGTPSEGQPGGQQDPGAQVLEHLTTRSAVYLVRCLVREGASQRIDAAAALVYWPGDSGEPAKIIQWRQPDKFPGWTAWFRSPEG